MKSEYLKDVMTHTEIENLVAKIARYRLKKNKQRHEMEVSRNL